MHGSSGNTLGVVPRFNINLCDFSENVRSLLFYSIKQPVDKWVPISLRRVVGLGI